MSKADKVSKQAMKRARYASVESREGAYPMAAEDDAYKRARHRAEDVAGYWRHAIAYAIVIGALILVNLITWSGYFWAIWPAMGWGVGLLFHTMNVFGPQMNDEWKERKAREWAARESGPPTARYGEGRVQAPFAGNASTEATPRRSTRPTVTLVELTERAGEEVDRLRRVSRRIPTPEVRRQALEVLASADQIVAALGDGTADETTARTFLDRYLGPTGTILDRYQRLAVQNIQAPALRRVEEHDLPLLNRRMNELRAQIHQGDLIDLEVASEMLAFELEEPDTSGPPLTHGTGSRPTVKADR